MPKILAFSHVLARTHKNRTKLKLKVFVLDTFCTNARNPNCKE